MTEMCSFFRFSEALTKLGVGNPPPILPEGSSVSSAQFSIQKRRDPFDRAFLQPIGMLFTVNRDHECYACVGSEQGNVHEETTNGNHTVSTCFEGGNVLDGKTLSFSTSHNLDTKNFLKFYSSNDLKGGVDFSLNVSHHFDQESLLSTSFQTGSYSDPILNVELQEGKENVKATKNFEANLKTGQKLFHMRSKNVLGPKILMTKSLDADLSGDASLGIEVAATISKSFSLSSRVMIGFNGSKELYVQGAQSMGKHTMAEASVSTNITGQHSVSMDVKHKVHGKEFFIQLTSYCLGIPKVSITTSFSKERDHWRWKYRNEATAGHSLELEWKHKCSSCHYYSLCVSTKNWGFNVHAELQLPFN